MIETPVSIVDAGLVGLSLTVELGWRGVPLQTVALNEPAVVKAYERHLVLVRPDGHVAWRGHEVPQNPRGLIDRVYRA